MKRFEKKMLDKTVPFVAVTLAACMMSLSGCGASKGQETEAVKQSAKESSAAVETQNAQAEMEKEAETKTQTQEAEIETEKETGVEKETETEKETGTEAQATENKAETSETAETPVGQAFAAGGSVSESDYAVSVKGVSVALGSDFGDCVGTLGDPDEYSAAKSCTETGDDKVYTYGGFTIYTYVNDGRDIVTLIEITGSDALPSGIHVGSTRDEVIEAYGNGYREDGAELLYENGNKTLGLQMADNKVSSDKSCQVLTWIISDFFQGTH